MANNLVVTESDIGVIHDLILRVEEGERELLPMLRQHFRDMPELLDEFGNLSRHAIATLTATLDSGHDGRSFAIEQNVALIAEAVAGPDPSPLERLLAQRIATDWALLSYFDWSFSESVAFSKPWTKDQQHRYDKAHQRYMRAIESLARVRRLLGPAIHLNLTQIAVLAGMQQPADAGDESERR